MLQHAPRRCWAVPCPGTIGAKPWSGSSASVFHWISEALVSHALPIGRSLRLAAGAMLLALAGCEQLDAVDKSISDNRDAVTRSTESIQENRQAVDQAT